MDAMSSINSWKETIAQAGAIPDARQRKSALIDVIRQVGEIIRNGAGAPETVGEIAWELFQVSHLSPADHTELIKRMEQITSLYTSEGVVLYRDTGWRVEESRLVVRADELISPSFWKDLSKKLTSDIRLVIIQAPGDEECSLSRGVVQEAVKQAPDPQALTRSVVCKLRDEQEATAIGEIWIRVIAPAFIPALGEAFTQKGTLEQPLELSCTAEELKLAQKCVESDVNRMWPFSGQETAVLLELFEMLGRGDLKERCYRPLRQKIDDMYSTRDPEANFQWAVELYANIHAGRTDLREQLEDYFSEELLRPGRWDDRSSGIRRGFPSMHKPVEEGVTWIPNKLPPGVSFREFRKIAPEGFQRRIDLLNEIHLQRLTVKRKPPLWYWPQVSRLRDLTSVTFQGINSFSDDCATELKKLPQLRKLIFMDQEVFDRAKTKFGEGYEIVFAGEPQSPEK